MAKYIIKRGFRPPTPSNDSIPDTATWEVYKKVFFQPKWLVAVFNTQEEALSWVAHVKAQKD